MKYSNKKTILLIDDDEIMHTLIGEYLKKTGLNLISALNGIDGIRLVKEKKINLVLLDVNMPLMSGYETLTKIKEIKPGLDVVMCTANDKYHSDSFDCGAIAYLIKPITNEKLLAIIDLIFKLQMAI